MSLIQYFAYGSNMLTERLQARCPSAEARLVASADNYALAFCKKSQDGSGKATLSSCLAPPCRVFGVVFDIDRNELLRLDKSEGKGKGYDRIDNFRVHADGQPEMPVITYIASFDSIDPNLCPYDWYLNLVLAGARQHGLPAQYIEAIKTTPSAGDPEPNRASRLEALKLLGKENA